MQYYFTDELCHHGIKGQKWGVRHDKPRIGRKKANHKIVIDNKSKNNYKIEINEKKEKIEDGWTMSTLKASSKNGNKEYARQIDNMASKKDLDSAYKIFNNKANSVLNAYAIHGKREAEKVLKKEFNGHKYGMTIMKDDIADDSDSILGLDIYGNNFGYHVSCQGGFDSGHFIKKVGNNWENYI